MELGSQPEASTAHRHSVSDQSLEQEIEISYTEVSIPACSSATPMDEMTLAQEVVQEIDPALDCSGPKYQVVTSRRGKERLVDPDGYTYNIRRRGASTVYWQCTIRNRAVRCNATVVQHRPDSFRKGPRAHIHPVQTGASRVARLRRGVKSRAQQDVLQAACEMIGDALRESNTSDPVCSLLGKRNLQREANQISDSEESVPSASSPTPGRELSLAEEALVDHETDPARDHSDSKYETVMSRRGKLKLVDPDGYTYNIRRRGAVNIYWQCSVRNKAVHCSASIVQHGAKSFMHGLRPHLHPAQTDASDNARISHAIKSLAQKNVFQPAGEIVQDVLLKHNSPLSKKNLARAANRARKASQPKEPKDLNFELDVKHIPDGFLQQDIWVADKRHIILATREMLYLLSRARKWYADVASEVVPHPFVQLLSINAFLRQDGETKQVPLAFALMSGQKTRDYQRVFQTVVSCLPWEPKVDEILVDFEKGIWKALRSVLPRVQVKGCSFHFNQAVRQKILETGLQLAYTIDEKVHRYCRMLLSLPYLPQEQIPPVFLLLKEKAEVPELQALTAYIRTTWIDSPSWKPESWSVYKQSVRTLKDVEGWQRRLNVFAKKSHLTFYLLVALLHEEAKTTSVEARPVTEAKLQRNQRKMQGQLQGRLFELWDEYSNRKITPMQLLEACSRIYTPDDIVVFR